MDIASKQKQIRNSAIYIIAVVANNLISLIALPIFTRILSKEDYGIFALAEVYGLFVSGLANFGMIISYNRNFFKYYNDRNDTAKLLYSTLLFTSTIFLLLFSLTWIFQDRLSFLIFRSNMYSSFLVYNFLADFLVSIQAYFLCFYKNSGNAKINVAYTIAFCVLNFMFSFYFVAIVHIGVMGLVYAKLFAGVLIVFLLGYRFLVRLPFSFDARILLESVKIAYPMTPRIFLGVIGTRFDQYMIGLLGSLGGVGIYNIGQKVAAMVFVYITSLENVFSPHVYKSMFEQKERGGKIIGSYLTAFAYISIFLALVVIVFSREIISLLTPPAYHNAADIIVILSLYYGFLFFEKITGMQLVYAKKTHITSVLVIATYALNIALNIPFIIRWGAFGAAWATLLTGLISGTVFFFVAQKYYLIVWEYRKIAVIFFLFIFSAFSILTLNAFYVWYPVQFAVKLLLITSYILLGLKLRLITKDNFLLVKNALLFKKFDAVPPADVAEVVAPEPGSLKP